MDPSPWAMGQAGSSLQAQGLSPPMPFVSLLMSWQLAPSVWLAWGAGDTQVSPRGCGGLWMPSVCWVMATWLCLERRCARQQWGQCPATESPPVPSLDGRVETWLRGGRVLFAKALRGEGRAWMQGQGCRRGEAGRELGVELGKCSQCRPCPGAWMVLPPSPVTPPGFGLRGDDGGLSCCTGPLCPGSHEQQGWGWGVQQAVGCACRA